MNDSCREVLSWLRGGDITPDPEMESRFIDTLASLVHVRIREMEKDGNAAEIERRRRSRTACASIVLPSISSITGLDTVGVSSPTPDMSVVPEAEALIEYVCLDIDSVALARTLIHFGALEGHVMNMSQIQSVLYVVYGTWLASRHERITSEHPHMWEYGPVFPRVYNRLRKDNAPGKDEYDCLKDEHNELWQFLGSCFRRFAWTKGCVLVAPHVAASSPWGMTRKSNPDKWGAVIEDRLIDEWFRRHS